MVTLKLMLFLLLTVVCLQQSSTGVVDGNGFPARVERFVMETESDGEDSFSTMVLAEERTRRKDPLNYFKYYDGGWNITDDHYFSSVAYSAAPLFTIATIWFLGFGLSLLVICCYYLFRRRTSYGYSRTAYALSVAFLTLFTISAIVGCVVLYTGQQRFHNSTTATLDYVVKQSKDTSYKLNNVLDILETAKGIGVDQVSLPESIKDNIDRVDTMVNEAATDLEFETADNQDGIQYVLNSVRLSLIIIAAVMLLVALLGFSKPKDITPF
ncbi:chaperonin-like protein [Tanacetum coccineum]